MMQIKAENCKNCNLKLQENIYSFKMTLFNEINILGPQDFFRPLSLLLNHIVAFFVALIWSNFDLFFASGKPQNNHKSMQMVSNEKL